MQTNTRISEASSRAVSDPYQVMVVDDSAVIRGFLTRWLEEDPEIKVVASANNGIIALRELTRAKPEVVILDVEMPEMDGLTALPKLMKLDPSVKIIMASTLTRRNADISLKALSAGAADYIPKPTSNREIQKSDSFRHDLIGKVKALGASRRIHNKVPEPRRSSSARPAAELAKRTTIKTGLYGKSPISLKKLNLTYTPQILAIGSSTGGPQALFALFRQLKDKISLPILITQHMPATFTAILAEHLDKIWGKKCAEAVDGEPIVENRVYIAPGDWHMTVEGTPSAAKIKLKQTPPENFCRPAVDPMLRSLLHVYGPKVLTVILTGMGHDGLGGCQKLAEAGGNVIAQDEESSVVWGMPGAVATGGLCSAVLPIGEIGAAVNKAITGRAA